MTLLDKTKKEVTEKEPLDLMSLTIRGARSGILTWWLLCLRGTHLMRPSRAVTLPVESSPSRLSRIIFLTYRKLILDFNYIN